ncbi:MAG: TIGR03936 family radical SAM-associated protein [Clostridia bacterium]|nr:TIGR03936 family radical SAM-associated protein [Clostridia bacterium]
MFEKSERVRHIGHLDIMRTVGRALRRTGLPLSYSKGFSPHVLLTFASALSVGAVGRRELMDVTLDEDVTPEAFLAALNAALPPEMQASEARPLPEKHPALMAMVQGAEYELRLMDAEAADAFRAALPGFLAQAEIITPRKTKSGVKDCDIRPLIHRLSMEGDALVATLALTERESCKPDMLLTALSAFAGIDVPRALVIRRRLLGLSEDGTLVPLETL